MPQPPNSDCPMCKGSGSVCQEFYDSAPGLSPAVGTPCLCTVTTEEVEAAIPGVIEDILKQIDVEQDLKRIE